MELPLHILDSFNNKCSFLLNAIMEEKLGRVPNKEEIRLNLSISAEPPGIYIFCWDGDKIFGGEIRMTEEGRVHGEWELPEHMMQNEIVLEKLNKW